MRGGLCRRREGDGGVSKPKVLFIGTGGTMSALGIGGPFDIMDYGAKGRFMEADEIIRHWPQVLEKADVVPIKYRNVASTALGPVEWLEILALCHSSLAAHPDAAGIVIGHGTATLEETAYFLSLTHKLAVPIVVVGAQRPSSGLATDAPMNLANGIRVAADPFARGMGALVVLKAGIAAAVALEEEGWLNRALRLLPGELERQFFPDGGHVERSPAQHLAALQDLIEIRNLLHGAGANTPAQLGGVIERACQALRFYRHQDGGLALFNGTRDEPATLVDLVLHHGQARGRAPMLLQDTGFHRMQGSRTLVIVDCGAPPPGRAPDLTTGMPRAGDRFSHAGTMSFELSVGRDRLIVNCGASPAAEPVWRDALRATAAHSTLTLADTNSSELREEGLGRRPERVLPERQEQDHAHWLEITHDGWRKPFGAIHRRTLYLAEGGDDLRGEDVVELPGGVTETLSWVVRFHLHPGVSASLVEDDAAVLMRLPSGHGWRLRARGARIALEESVYAAAETRRSQQIVLYAEPDAEAVRWAVSRVVAGGSDAPLIEGA
ncbi:MAG: hypothetical protein EBX37_03395 [Alphaproteobacteria bacterium]|nr:hypothetical protein [Alphaproteobacteria bacterium]